MQDLVAVDHGGDSRRRRSSHATRSAARTSWLPASYCPARMQGPAAERFVVLNLRLLAVTFAVVGILFIAVPSGVLDVISDVGEWFGNDTRAPHTQEYLWLALAFAYMVVITGICLRRPGRRRPLPAAAAGPRRRQDRLLARLARLLPDPRTRLHLPAQLPRRRLPGAAGALALGAGGTDRPPRRARLTARAGALGRRAAHPERDLRGDGAGHRRPARGRARRRRLRPGRRVPRARSRRSVLLPAAARACAPSSGCRSPGASAASTRGRPRTSCASSRARASRLHHDLLLMAKLFSTLGYAVTPRGRRRGSASRSRCAARRRHAARAGRHRSATPSRAARARNATW